MPIASTETLKKLYRHVESRRLKALAMGALQLLGRRRLVLRLDTTNLCNLRCRMCYYSSLRPRGREEMSGELFEKIASEVFPAVRFLYLSCATEPLMNKSFASFLATTARHKVPFVSFCTNGQLMSEGVAQAAVAAGLSEIVFSVDGAGAETYEYIRRGAKWDRLLEAFEMLRRAKRACGTDLPALRINFTCMQRNLEELPEMLPLAARHGVASVHVRHLLAFDDAGSELSCSQQMQYQQRFNQVGHLARLAARRLGVRLFLPEEIPAARAARPAAAARRLHPREANPYCMLPWFSAIITPSGDYRICSAHEPLGNLARESFWSIYQGQRMRQLRRGLLGRARGACSWTCRQEAYDAASEPESSDPGNSAEESA